MHDLLEKRYDSEMQSGCSQHAGKLFKYKRTLVSSHLLGMFLNKLWHNALANVVLAVEKGRAVFVSTYLTPQSACWKAGSNRSVAETCLFDILS